MWCVYKLYFYIFLEYLRKIYFLFIKNILIITLIYMNFTYTNSNNTSCNFASYYSRNSKINVNYSLVLNKPTSIVYGKPIANTCYSSRMLRLRILLK